MTALPGLTTTPPLFNAPLKYVYKSEAFRPGYPDTPPLEMWVKVRPCARSSRTTCHLDADRHIPKSIPTPRHDNRRPQRQPDLPHHAVRRHDRQHHLYAPAAPHAAAKKFATDESIYIIPIDVVGRTSQAKRTTFGRLDRAAYFNSVLSIVATRQRIKPFTLCRGSDGLSFGTIRDQAN